jgi:hypothetical protein
MLHLLVVVARSYISLSIGSVLVCSVAVRNPGIENDMEYVMAGRKYLFYKQQNCTVPPGVYLSWLPIMMVAVLGHRMHTHLITKARPADADAPRVFVRYRTAFGCLLWMSIGPDIETFEALLSGNMRHASYMFAGWFLVVNFPSEHSTVLQCVKSRMGRHLTRISNAILAQRGESVAMSPHPRQCVP